MKDYEKAVRTLEETRKGIEDDSKYIADHSEDKSRKTSLDNRKKELGDRKTALDGIAKDLVKLAKLKKTKDEKEKIHAEAVAKWENADRELAQMKRAHLAGQAAILAESLEEGTPCPVCGSVHHPNKAVHSGEIPSSAEIKTAESEVASLYEEAENLREEKDEATSEYAEAKGNIDSKLNILGIEERADSPTISDTVETEKTTAEKEIQNLAPKLDKLASSVAKIDSILNTLDDRRNGFKTKKEKVDGESEKIAQRTQTQAQEKSAIEEMKKPLGFNDRKAAETEIKRLRKEADAIEKKIKDADEAVESIKQDIAAKQSALKEKNSNMGNLTNTRDTYLGEYRKMLSESGFADEDDFKAMLALAPSLEENQESVTAYKNSVTANHSSLKTVRVSIAGRERPANMEELEQKKTDAENNSRAISETLSQINQRLKSNKAIQKKFDEDVKAMGALLERDNMLKDLSDTANGFNDLKMTFNQYVLAQRLEGIILSASERLGMMSAGRYELKRKEDVEDKRSNSGLDLEILDHHSNERRSVRTLSGGESFMASLALSLALSRTIQNNARGKKIESLFIDEGFGSLDEETIDQAINVLNNISDGMNVGIISHVPRLLECIDNKVRVEYTPGKGSRIIRTDA